MDNRHIIIISKSPITKVEFTSNTRRIQRNITQKELKQLENHINDLFFIDNFCYNIV